MTRKKNKELIEKITTARKYYAHKPIDHLLEEILQYLSEEGERLVIETPLGANISAELSTDPTYPGIYLDVTGRQDTALLEYTDTERELRLLVWSDREKEDYTNKFILLREGN